MATRDPREIAEERLLALSEDVRAPFVRALAASLTIDTENFDNPQPESPTQIAHRLGLSLHSLYKNFIVIAAHEAVRFLEKVGNPTSIATFRKKYNPAKAYRERFGREVSKEAVRW